MEKKKTILIGSVLLVFLSVSMLKLSFPQIEVDSNRFPKSNADNQTVDYLIITSDLLEESLIHLKEWKMQRGLMTHIITVESIYDTYEGRDHSEMIKNCILDYYTNNGTSWVLLGGDVDQVPSRYVKTFEGFDWDGDVVLCDSYYTDLDHDWDSNNDTHWGTEDDDYTFTPEVAIGRLPANEVDEMIYFTSNIIQYEKAPALDDWMTSALFAGAYLMFDEDWNDDGVADYLKGDANRHHNFVIDRFPEEINTTLMAEVEGLNTTEYEYDIPLSKDNLLVELNKGYNLVSITGHGNPEAMVRSIFTQDYDGDGLLDYNLPPSEGGETIDETTRIELINTYNCSISAPQDKYGLYYLGGCSTGTFDFEYDCMSEMFLKSSAIGSIAGAYVVWGEDEWYERDHGGWYSEGLQSRFWEYLFITNHPGEALELAKEDYIADRLDAGVDADFPGWEDKILKQFNLLGDPEIPIWQNHADSLNASFSEEFLDEETLNFTIAALTGATAVENVTITYFDNGTLFWEGLTNSSGMVTIPFNPAIVANMTLTLSKNQYIPYQTPFMEIPERPSVSVEIDPEKIPTSTKTTSTGSGFPDDNLDEDPTISGSIVFLGLFSLLGVGFVFLKKKGR
jgi:hypothetical protein